MTKSLLVLSLAAALAACKPSAEQATPAAAAPAPQLQTAAPAPAAVAQHPALVNFQCGEQRISARFEHPPGHVTLSIGGQPLLLAQAMAASGARYADDQGNEFWNKGSNATLTLTGKPPLDCTQTELGSPWDEARARGVGYRALGQEPGWFVEVDQGTSPDLRLSLDNGTRQLKVSQARALEDGSGFSGKSSDGVAVELRVVTEACADVMSGEAFDTSAQLTVDGQRLQGCGRFLAD